MALAMNAAIRWLADSVRGRAGAWTDRGVRLRVIAIAAIILIGNLSALVDDLRAPPPIAPALHVVIDAVVIVGAIGVLFRSKLAYMVAYLYTFVLGMSAASGVIWIPILAVMSGDVQAGSPVDGQLIEQGAMLLWMALLVLGVWKYYWLYERLRRFAVRFQAPLYGLVIAGAAIVVAWSIVNGVAPSLVGTWLASTQIDPYLRLAFFAAVLLLVYAYTMWSYATLRGRAVRDAFDLP